MPFSAQATADALEARIKANRPLDLPVPWAEELIWPAYDGLSILNLPHTAADIFDVELPHHAPLDPAVWGGASLDGIERVVLILLDGLSYRWLSLFMQEDAALRESVGALTGGRGPLPLTSIAPSTTAAALTTLWTGAGPAAHGIVGFRAYLRELSMLATPLFMQPIGAMRQTPHGILEEWGIVPEEFVPVPGLAEVLGAAGVPSHLFMLANLMGSGLSRILHRGIAKQNFHRHMGTFDIWPRLREVLAKTAGQRAFLYMYHDAVDKIGHTYGAGGDMMRHEITRTLAELAAALRDPAGHDGQTLVLITADHGHHDAPQRLKLNGDDPRVRPIAEALHAMPGGEARLPLLHLRHGHRQNVIDTIEGEYADGFAWLDPAEALAAGLFGPGEVYAETPHRLGELILVPRLGWITEDAAIPPHLVGYHGGLSDFEMLVPLLWQRV